MSINQAIMDGIYGFFVFGGFMLCLMALMMIIGFVASLISHSGNDDDGILK